MIVLFVREASVELAEARAWYETQRAGLGDEFQRSLDATVKAIGLSPQRFPFAYKTRRRAFLRRFPYFLLFEVVGDVVLVLGCIHFARHPSTWRRPGPP